MDFKLPDGQSWMSKTDIDDGTLYLLPRGDGFLIVMNVSSQDIAYCLVLGAQGCDPRDETPFYCFRNALVGGSNVLALRGAWIEAVGTGNQRFPLPGGAGTHGSLVVADGTANLVVRQDEHWFFNLDNGQASTRAPAPTALVFKAWRIRIADSETGLPATLLDYTAL